MITVNDTSLTKAADPVLSDHLANVTSSGSVAFNGLGKGDALTANTDYPVSNPPAAEESTVAPIAGGEERPMEICAWCGFMMHYGRGPVSHGICPSCREVFFPDVPHV